MQRKYRFTNKELNILKEFIQNNIDKNIKIKKSQCFECDIDNRTVYISNKKFTPDTEMFMNWLCKQKEYTPINHILISILHEIGHIKTYTPELEEERDLLYGIYDFMHENKIMSTEELNNKYFNIPDEKIATMWGINFYKNNKIKCDKLIKDLCIM